ncbi:hypothetical protein [Halomonas sp. KM-1]|uniref:hypothetical protein n=1 Tax=Halomonas sp. KM-1 TaxID=590061 RepID=UPI00114645F5|nr:hypothetical protein [Halomonas sp. KM-1]
MRKVSCKSPAESIRFHQRHPEISIDRYVKAKMVELWNSICGVEKVYLDKRFWILLRDADMGRSTKSASDQLLREIRAAVQQGAIVFPISESVFFELLKQQDLKTRRATAALIDEFSHGVTLVPYEQRVGQELISVFAKLSNMDAEFHGPTELVWSKLSYVLGVVHPSSTPFDSTDELVIQKAFFDHMWQISLVDMIELLESNEDLVRDAFSDTAEHLNKLNRQHQSEVRKFKQVYLDEFRGALSLFMHIPRMWLENSYARESNSSLSLTDNERRAQEYKLHTVFGSLVTKKRVALMMPSLHIPALCHAAVRWDKGRKLAPNDFYDFKHAAAAVGYCNAFMTEKPLRTMLQQKHLGLEKDFPCTVISDIDEAISWIRGRVGG